MQKTDIAIIGGGASGMMAAITAARMGARVTLLEKMEKSGKKLLITGRGRCNLSNINMDASHYHCGQTDFVEKVLAQFNLDQTLDFFGKIGIPTKTEKEGKVIPWSEQSAAVLDTLLMEMEESGVVEKTGFAVHKITTCTSGFILEDSSKNSLEAAAVILATGGKSYPKLGSNGEGYRLARHLGHTIIEPQPALVHVKCKAPFLRKIDGNKFTGVASLAVNNKITRSYEGEILFTDYGLSGIPLLQLSRSISEGLSQNQKVQILLDLFPDIPIEKMIDILTQRKESRPGRSIQDWLSGLLHKKLIPVVLIESGITDSHKNCGSLSHRQISALARLLKAWTFHPTGTRDWDVAQVTAGGINTSEIDPASLESRIQPGLFIAGEVMDVDGECGGYNLQWAWSSGYVAGKHAAQSLEGKQ